MPTPSGSDALIEHWTQCTEEHQWTQGWARTAQVAMPASSGKEPLLGTGYQKRFMNIEKPFNGGRLSFALSPVPANPSSGFPKAQILNRSVSG